MLSVLRGQFNPPKLLGAVSQSERKIGAFDVSFLNLKQAAGVSDQSMERKRRKAIGDIKSAKPC